MNLLPKTAAYSFFQAVIYLAIHSFLTPPEDLDSEARSEKWDKVRIICLQPFRKDKQYGLSLFRLHTSAEVT